MNSDILLTYCFHATYFAFLTEHFYIQSFVLPNSEQVDGNTIVCTFGRTARRSNVSDYVYRRHEQGLKCSCLTDKKKL